MNGKIMQLTNLPEFPQAMHHTPEMQSNQFET